MSALIPALLGFAENVALPVLGNLAQNFLTEGLPNIIRSHSGYEARPVDHASITGYNASRVPIRAQATDYHHPVFHNPNQPSAHVFNNEAGGHIVSPTSFRNVVSPAIPVETNAAGLVGGTRHYERHPHYKKLRNAHALPIKKKKK